MKYLFKHWANLKRSLANKFILLFLDYDGTLTPIVKTPERGVISAEAKRILKKLSQIPKCKLFIISGRALKDIKKKVGLSGIIYAGNHGLEIEGPRVKFKSPILQKHKLILQRIKNQLKKKVSGIKGVIVEDKKLTLSLHYRLVPKKQSLKVKKIFQETVRDYLLKKKIKVESGKMVLEIRPPIKWDKGKVVLWLLAREKFILRSQPLLPVYLGDDITDEDAFKVVRNKGLGIFVGKPRKSFAQYYLKNTREIFRFLKGILEL